MKRKNLIRVGDKVKIIKPDVFKRCGYPLSKEDVLRNKLKTEDVKVIDDFMKHFGLVSSCPIEDLFTTKMITTPFYNKVFDRIADAVAYGILSKELFGGRERTIHTEHKPEFQDCVGIVHERRVVNTGVYNPGWYDGYESEAASLAKQKCHVIFTVLVWYGAESNRGLATIEIEKENLEKIYE